MVERGKIVASGWAAGLSAVPLVLAVLLAPAPVRAQGLFDSIIGGLNRAFGGPPQPSSDPAYADPDGFVPPARRPQQRPLQSRLPDAPANPALTRATQAPMGDPTLRPGDVVATTNGLLAYTGGRGGLSEFVPVKSYPYFSRGERGRLLALKVTPPDHRWNAEVPLGPSTTTSAWKPSDFAGIRTAQR